MEGTFSHPERRKNSLGNDDGAAGHQVAWQVDGEGLGQSVPAIWRGVHVVDGHTEVAISIRPVAQGHEVPPPVMCGESDLDRHLSEKRMKNA
jgi:hypothetical protein